MAQIQSAVYPVNRKTKNAIQWQDYISAQLREIRGLEKHKKTKNFN